MSLGPFLVMLTSRGLFQTRVDTFEDASEGAFGFRNIKISPGLGRYLGVEPRSFVDDTGSR